METTNTGDEMTLTKKMIDDMKAAMKDFGPVPQYNPFFGVPLHIMPDFGVDLAEKTVRIPAHPLIKWLSKFFRIDPWVEVRVPAKDRTGYGYMINGAFYLPRELHKSVVSAVGS